MPADLTQPAQDGPPALLTLGMIRRSFVPVGERTLWRWISSGTFPRPDLAIGGKTRLWKRSTIEGWIENQSQNQIAMLGLPAMSPENYSVPGGRP